MAVTSNGIIYCVTELGGIADSCTVGIYNTVTDSFDMIHQFFANEATGGVPFAGVITANNGLIYGTTAQGGVAFDSATAVYGRGYFQQLTRVPILIPMFLIFRIVQVMALFRNSLQAADGNLYGIVPFTTFNSVSGTYAVQLQLFFQTTCLKGSIIFLIPLYPDGLPAPALVQGPDLKLYGALPTTYNGQNIASPGVLFSYDIADRTFTGLRDFTAADWHTPGRLAGCQ